MGLFNNKENEKNDKKATDVSFSSPRNNNLYLIDYENVADAGVKGIDTLSSTDSVVIFYGSKIKTVSYESLIAITKSKALIEHLKAEKTAKNYLDFQLTTYLGYKLGQKHYDGIFIISHDSGFDAVIDFWTNKGLSIKRQSAIIEPIEKNDGTSPSKANKPASTVKKTRKKSTKTKADNKTTILENISDKDNSAEIPKLKSTKQNINTAKEKPTEKNNKNTKARNELRPILRSCSLTAPEYKKLYDAFEKSTTTLEYNNALQKAFGNDRTSALYKATVKIFEKEHNK